jgi:hypothetical protein
LNLTISQKSYLNWGCIGWQLIRSSYPMPIFANGFVDDLPDFGLRVTAT